jgi:ATP synthase protein I
MSSPNSPSEDGANPLDDTATGMFRTVRRQKEKKVECRRRGDQSVWSVIGMMGMVGWGVILPAVLGGLLGRWLDGKLGTRPDLAVLFALLGLGLGCWNAWRMVNRERQEQA